MKILPKEDFILTLKTIVTTLNLELKKNSKEKEQVY